MADRRVDRYGASVTAERGVPVVWAEEGRIVRFHAQDGLSLALRIFDRPRSVRLPLICLPGLSRNSRDFIPLGRFLARHPAAPRRVIAVDYRGRGLSARDRNWRNYRPIVEAQDVIAAATSLGIDRAIFVGTSRGGIIAMLLGVLRPTLVAGVVLNDIGPVIQGAGLARIKTMLSGRHVIAGWEEAVMALRSMLESQYPSLSADEWRRYAEASFAETRAGLAPLFDRNLVRTFAGTDVTGDLPSLWPQFMSLARLPVLAIRGGLSDLLAAPTFAEMAKRHPKLEQHGIPDQGHAPLLHDEESLERIASFAERCDQPSPTGGDL